jgi:hypothetical protein
MCRYGGSARAALLPGICGWVRRVKSWILVRNMGAWHCVGAGSGRAADRHAGVHEPVAERCGRLPGCRVW